MDLWVTVRLNIFLMRPNFFMPFGSSVSLWQKNHNEQSQMDQLLLLKTWRGQAGGGRAARLTPDPDTVWDPPREMGTGAMSPFLPPQGQLDSELSGVYNSLPVAESHLPPKPTFLGRPTRELATSELCSNIGHRREASGTVSSTPLNI